MNNSINNNNKIIFDSITTSPLNTLLNIQQKENNILKEKQEKGVKEYNLPRLEEMEKLNYEIFITKEQYISKNKREFIIIKDKMSNLKNYNIYSNVIENKSDNIIQNISDNKLDYDYKINLCKEGKAKLLNKSKRMKRRFGKYSFMPIWLYKDIYAKYFNNIDTNLISNNMEVKNDNLINLENNNKNNSLLDFYSNNMINNQDLNLYELKANKLMNYLKLLSEFNPELVKNKDILYKYNKSANPSRKSVYTLLNSSLIKMKALISNPNYYSSSNKVEVFLNIYYSYKKLNKQIKTIYKRLKSLPNLLQQNKIAIIKYNKDILNYQETNQNSNSLNDPNKYFIYYNNLKEKNKLIKKYLSLKREYNYLLNSYSFLNRNLKNIEYLCQILTQIFNKPVVLNLTRVYKPSYDSNILAQIIGKVSNKIKLNKINKKTLKKAKIIKPRFLINKTTDIDNPLISLLKGNLTPAFLSGFKVKVHGRLLTQRVIPRRTVKIIQGGSLARGKADLLNKARYTNKNKRGSYSITITTGHTINKIS